MKKTVKTTRWSMQVQSDINLTRANIAQVEKGIHYSEEDKEILIPHYKKQLTKLENELAEIIDYMDVVEPKTINPLTK